METSVKKSFWFNLMLVLLTFVLLYISFFATLHCVTKHGEELVIPGVKGRNMNEAVQTLKNMRFEVFIDSTYEPDSKPLAVLKQVPDSGAVVKEGRTVFLTVNMLNPPHIPMPNLVNLSFRSAEMLLKNNKLLLGDTTYKPDIAAGAILEQRYKGEDIKPGEMIAQGSKVSLVIGDGLGNTQFDVPAVTKMSVDEALTLLAQYNVQPIITAIDQMSQITDTASAIIVDQSPRAINEAGVANRIKQGDIIDLIIMQNPEPTDFPDNNTTPGSDVNSGAGKDAAKKDAVNKDAGNKDAAKKAK
jgi:beta-lactam-binding protein with PASTA domain